MDLLNFVMAVRRFMALLPGARPERRSSSVLGGPGRTIVAGLPVAFRPLSHITTPLLALAVALAAIFINRPFANGICTFALLNLLAEAATLPETANALPGMPPILNKDDIYEADHPGNLSPLGHAAK